MDRSRHPRSRLVRLAFSAVGLGLLAHVVGSNRGSIREVLAHRPDAAGLGLAFVLALAALGMTFVRWWLLVRAQGLPLRFADAVRIGFLGSAIDLVVPGQVGGDVFKASFLGRGREGGPRARAVASIVVDRAVGVLGLFTLAAVMGVLNWSAAGPAVRRLIAAVWVVWSLGVVGLAALLTPALFRPLERLAARRERLRALLGELRAASVSYRDRKAGVMLGLAMSTASHLLYALSFFAVSRALLPHPPGLRGSLLMIPLVLLSTVVPLPFGALGLSEQVSDDLFALLGTPLGALPMLGSRVVALAVACVSIAVSAASAGSVHPLEVRPEAPPG